MIDSQILKEGKEEELIGVTNLAKGCLKLDEKLYNFTSHQTPLPATAKTELPLAGAEISHQQPATITLTSATLFPTTADHPDVTYVFAAREPGWIQPRRQPTCQIRLSPATHESEHDPELHLDRPWPSPRRRQHLEGAPTPQSLRMGSVPRRRPRSTRQPRQPRLKPSEPAWLCLVEKDELDSAVLDLEDAAVLDIVDPKVLKEGTEEELIDVAAVAKQCLNLDGKRRPMKVLKEGTEEELIDVAAVAKQCLNLDGKRRPMKVLKEGTEEELIDVVAVAKQCLNLNGKRRPMKDISYGFFSSLADKLEVKDRPVSRGIAGACTAMTVPSTLLETFAILSFKGEGFL
ncbi:hypothetical protein AKJ16_DCAP14221 [Drosera capensis]